MILRTRSSMAVCILEAALRPLHMRHPARIRPQHRNGNWLSNNSKCARRGLSGVRSSSRVGFVGLGNMGSCMATNLVRAGHDVVVYDADESKTAALADASGATAAGSLQDLARNCGSIITMLPNTPHVEAVYMGKPPTVLNPSNIGDVSSSTTRAAAGEHAGDAGRDIGGLVGWVEKGTLLVDSSTIDPLTSRKINAAAARNGSIMLDAPVSGGVPAAANGTLTFIVGGSNEGVERARPLLESMGKNVVHCGDAGTGCVAKLCNNLCLAVSMIGVSEAMSLGSKMGMDPKVLAHALNTSTARCWSSDSYNPFPGVMPDVPSSRGFQGGFATSLMEKDLNLALQAARQSSQSLPMSALAHQLYSLMCGQSQGSSRKDFSSIYELISGKGATTLSPHSTSPPPSSSEP